MASIESRTNRAVPNFRVRWNDRVAGRRMSEQFATVEAAERFRALVETPQGDVLPPGWVLGQGFVAHAPGTILFAEAATRWESTREVSASPYTRRRYRRVLETQFLPRWRDWPVASITIDEVQLWVGQQHAAGVAAKTIANHHGVLHGVLELAVQRGWRPDNPCRATRLPKAAPKAKMAGYLSRDQVQALIDAAKPDAALLLRAAAVTGARWGELTALTGRDVTRDDLGVWVRVERAWSLQPGEDDRMHPVLKTPKTEAGFRDVWVALGDGAWLASLAADRGERHLFAAPRGGAWSYSSFHEQRWVPVLKAARAKDPSIPADATFHHIRHSYAWWAMSAGADLEFVRYQMGHTDIHMTARVYGGMTREGRARAGRVLDYGRAAYALPSAELEEIIGED